MRSCILLFYLLCKTTVFAQAKTDTLLQHILQGSNDPILQQVLKNKDTFRLQVIYTEINRDQFNTPSFRNYYFNTDTSLYFNPASTVKLPLALLALEKLNNIPVKKINKYTALQIDSGYAKQSRVYNDSTAQNIRPSIAHYIKKAFLVSDNDSYNRLYEFVGQQSINRNLHNMGYKGLRITRQFLGLTPEENRHTNPVNFIDASGRLIYAQPSAYNSDSFYFGKIINVV